MQECVTNLALSLQRPSRESTWERPRTRNRGTLYLSPSTPSVSDPLGSCSSPSLMVTRTSAVVTSDGHNRPAVARQRESFIIIEISFFFPFLVGDGLVQPEALNKKAIQIINRVRDKLTGEFCCPIRTFDEKQPAVQLNQIVFKCRKRLFPRWHAGCSHTSGAPHQTGHIPRKPVPVLHRMVSTHAALPQLFFSQDREMNKTVLDLFLPQVPLLVRLHRPRDFWKETPSTNAWTLGIHWIN